MRYLIESDSFPAQRRNADCAASSPRDGFMIAEDRVQSTCEHKQVLASSKTLGSFPMPEGQYEFPFDIPLPRKFLETVTGVKHNYHSYKVEATVAFRYRRNLVVSKPIRIYHDSDLEANYLTSDFSPVCDCSSSL